MFVCRLCEDLVFGFIDNLIGLDPRHHGAQFLANLLDAEQLETARGATALWQARPIDQAANVVDVPDEWRTDDQRTAAVGAPSPEEMQQAVRNIQAILNDNGFDAGPVDGIMGDKTREAIIAFQRQHGLTPTGEVDQAFVRKLLEFNDSST